MNMKADPKLNANNPIPYQTKQKTQKKNQPRFAWLKKY